MPSPLHQSGKFMVDPTRRGPLGGSIALMAAGTTSHLAAKLPKRADEVITLWRSTPSGGGGVYLTEEAADQSHDPAYPDRRLTNVGRPILVVKRAAKPNGTAVMLIRGGGYALLAYDNEGTEQAVWLNARGITSFVLIYRLPNEGWMQRADAAFQDAQRAMRLGMPKTLSAARQRELERFARDRPVIARTVTIGASGRSALDLPMRSNDVVLVKLSPLS
jgi:hypothetical protein